MYALYSIDNQYYQPDNNLVALYQEKPSLEALGRLFGGFPSSTDERTLDIVNLWKETEVRINDTNYRIEEIKFTPHY